MPKDPDLWTHVWPSLIVCGIGSYLHVCQRETLLRKLPSHQSWSCFAVVSATIADWKSCVPMRGHSSNIVTSLESVSLYGGISMTSTFYKRSVPVRDRGDHSLNIAISLELAGLTLRWRLHLQTKGHAQIFLFTDNRARC